MKFCLAKTLGIEAYAILYSSAFLEWWKWVQRYFRISKCRGENPF